MSKPRKLYRKQPKFAYIVKTDHSKQEKTIVPVQLKTKKAKLRYIFNLKRAMEIFSKFK